MAGYSDSVENSILRLYLNATAIANIADNAGSSPATNTWMSLHTSDPGDSGTQGTNEVGYTGYTRISVARTTAGWVVTNNSASPVATITFPTATSTSTGTLTHAAIGLSSATTGGIIIASGAISPNINYGSGVGPQLTTGSSFSMD